MIGCYYCFIKASFTLSLKSSQLLWSIIKPHLPKCAVCLNKIRPNPHSSVVLEQS